jgi:hypothetical protein
VHFIVKNWIFAYFSFSGVGKLILAALFFAGVNDTSEKFIGVVIDIGEQFLGFLDISDLYHDTGENVMTPGKNVMTTGKNLMTPGKIFL